MLTTVVMKMWAQVMIYHNIMRLMSLLHKENRWQKILKSRAHGGAKGSEHQIREW